MTQSNSRTGRRTAFLTGFLAGGFLGAAAVYFSFVPSGKEWLKSQSAALNAERARLYRSAQKKTIDLKRAADFLKHRSSDEDQQMIPIPKDYI
ncbi:hypothetical protein [Sporolactobacillus vineae]|uniref:hypothetical protein n=1 Tax=Sporolactobacillus vineae TaxID=444463 RepID=UPI0002881C8A|nr:hypothetical protein [Sporolactobacillus vineae]